MKKFSILALALVLTASMMTACRRAAEDMTHGNTTVAPTTATSATKHTEATHPSTEATQPSTHAATVPHTEASKATEHTNATENHGTTNPSETGAARSHRVRPSAH